MYCVYHVPKGHTGRGNNQSCIFEVGYIQIQGHISRSSYCKEGNHQGCILRLGNIHLQVKESGTYIMAKIVTKTARKKHFLKLPRFLIFGKVVVLKYFYRKRTNEHPLNIKQYKLISK